MARLGWNGTERESNAASPETGWDDWDDDGRLRDGDDPAKGLRFRDPPAPRRPRARPPGGQT